MRQAWILSGLLEQLFVEANDKFPVETGGILMGYRAKDSNEPVITDLVGPGPKAKHERENFSPDYDFQCSEVARIYEASGRIITYLGDWHTHPNGSGAMSGKDRRTLYSIAGDSSLRAPVPLMLILASGDPEWAPHLWEGEQSQFFLFIPRLATQRLELRVHEPGDCD